MVGSRWKGLALASTAVLLASGGQAPKEARENLRDLTLLRQAFAGRPAIAGRLSGDLQDTRPFTPGRLHFLGLLKLAHGDLDSAAATLEEAAARFPADTAVLNDLAVTYLERGRKESRAVDLLRALAAANRVLVQDPAHTQALFNRAWILARLHLPQRAAAAWQSYLEADPGTPWGDQAREQLRSLREPTLAELWEQQQPRLVAAVDRGDRASVRRIVSQFTHRARVEAEERALPAWGEALLAGDLAAAARQLTLIRALGDALLATTGDAMVADTVKGIDQAAAGGGGRSEHLAAGFRAFGSGLRLYRNQEGDAALPQLLASARLLRAEGSPFAGWADFYATACTHYSDSERSLLVFLHLGSTTDTARYTVLAGLIAWMEGTLDNNLNRPERALAAFRRAGDRLAATAAPETSGFIHLLRAETYERLGEVDQAWHERILALEAAARGGDRRRMHSTLHEATGAARRIDPFLALDFLAELLDSDRAWGNRGALTEAHFLAGRVLSELGRKREALASFRSAQGSAAEVGKGPQSDHISTEAELAAGEILADLDPRQAVSSLSAALDSAQKRGFLVPITRLLAIRARAHQALGDLDAAETDLGRAIREHERLRGALRDEQLRLSYFESAQAAFDAMIRLQAENRNAPQEAFAYAERARARLLLDLTAGTAVPGLPTPLDASAILPRLPAGVALIEYAVLPDRLLAWTASRDSLAMTVIPIAADALGREVRALRAAFERRASAQELRRAASRPFEILIRPLLAHVDGAASWVVVPDRSLVQVPFAALFDAQRGRYLTEDHVIAVTPSATLYLAAAERARAFSGRPWIALVVGDPAFDSNLHPRLFRLPEAAQEATEVVALYPGSVLLQAGAATREAFLGGLGAHRIVHFGGHALLPPGSPRRNRLLFAPGAGADSLSAEEIAGLRLTATEIVVLSACRTLPGGGEREGLNGLAAAFLAAGSPVVVTSLWNAEDRAARALMVAFHRALGAGESPAAALRQAQVQLLHAPDKDLHSPAAWGGFETIGGAITD